MSEDSQERKTKYTTLAKTETQFERQLVHPLEKNDPVLVDHVDFVKLKFLETMLPLVIKVMDNCVDSLVGHSLWVGGTFRFFRGFHSFIH